MSTPSSKPSRSCLSQCSVLCAKVGDCRFFPFGLLLRIETLAHPPVVKAAAAGRARPRASWRHPAGGAGRTVRDIYNVQGLKGPDVKLARYFGDFFMVSFCLNVRAFAWLHGNSVRHAPLGQIGCVDASFCNPADQVTEVRGTSQQRLAV